MKANLCLEAAERPQWPRLYLLSRPMSHGRMPSLVGDRGQVLRVLGWASTRIRNLSLVLSCPFQEYSDKHESSLTLRVALNKSWHRLI